MHVYLFYGFLLRICLIINGLDRKSLFSLYLYLFFLRETKFQYFIHFDPFIVYLLNNIINQFLATNLKVSQYKEMKV